ncbi:sensor histidine kinase [Pedobacter mucosus]|uniref:sensor histidine kinase n=1 Tax=Pedobacter mucosus TaxID=2895286 RepID=UPI001EE3F7D5|nr:ATP-binding protein [Pedobacter mucosus]UKT62977.1 PAS domain S-box protein [Pedobacter mucosus]
MDDVALLKAEIEQYKLRNDELDARVEELSDFVENASIPLHWVDRDGIILWANKAELDALGYSYEDYIGKPISNFHADADVIDDILTRLTRDETLNNYAARLKAKDGSIRHVLISSNVLRKDGEFVHTRCFTKDITEIKKEEERKAAFVSMVSHELKTPLTSFTAYVQLLLRRAIKENDDFATNALNRAEMQANKMASLLSDFLNEAKYNEGKVVLHKEDFDISELISEVKDDAQFVFGNGLNLSIDCEPVSVFGDRYKIGQVFTNLISNAIKYSPDGGNILIRCTRQEDKVQVSVTDKGMGINALDQQRLFERFYRVNDNKLSEVRGFGIGLYLVSEILRYHNSAINVISEEGKGSTFSFALDLGN